MELNVLESSKNRLVMEVEGIGHTFCNVLKKELWNDDSVTASAYSIEHPLVGVPRIIVETKRGSGGVVESLVDATERLEKQNKDFLKQFKKAL